MAEHGAIGALWRRFSQPSCILRALEFLCLQLAANEEEQMRNALLSTGEDQGPTLSLCKQMQIRAFFYRYLGAALRACNGVHGIG